MKTYLYKNLDAITREALTRRPTIDFDKAYAVVEPIMADVKANGDEAVKRYTEKFDGVSPDSLALSDAEIQKAIATVDEETKKAFEQAAANIEKFHKSQVTTEKPVETMKGVVCFRESRAIQKVGLYVPAGTAPLPSTVLMLGIPAKIAGCSEVVLCTPPPVAPEIIFAANLCGITKIFQVGGAQAIAAMAYGTASIPQVYKIFGPGNQYVTAAKMLASLDSVAIDMPAGPSEVLVIADDKADVSFVAADLLSQAEHGPDSQAVLLCLSERMADEVNREVEKQLADLPRRNIATRALSKSFILVCANVEEAFEFSNDYAPEHLILNVEEAERLTEKVINAGSVFIGQYSCESAGDYASGTNHTLPTYGYAKAYSGVSVDSFIKKITFQKLSEEGVRNLGPIVEKMAECEQLQAHKNAMTVRIKSLKQ